MPRKPPKDPPPSRERAGQRRTDGSILVGAVREACKLIERIVGPEKVAPALRELVGSLGVNMQDIPESNWEFGLRFLDPSAVETWPPGRTLAELRQYAFGAARPPQGAKASFLTGVEAKIGAVEALLAQIPVGPWGLRADAAARILDAAKARRAIDRGKTVDPMGLAVLGDVSVGRMHNLMAGPEREFTPWKWRVRPKAAREWLRKRGRLYPVLPPAEADGSEVDGDRVDPLFIPVSSTGQFFAPDASIEGVFVVGQGADRQEVAGYEDAVAALQEMAAPVWERLDERGQRTQERGARWVRVPRPPREGDH